MDPCHTSPSASELVVCYPHAIYVEIISPECGKHLIVPLKYPLLNRLDCLGVVCSVCRSLNIPYKVVNRVPTLSPSLALAERKEAQIVGVKLGRRSNRGDELERPPLYFLSLRST